MNPKPRPPMLGGEYIHISDPGTPSVPLGVPIVQLIPVGDGGPGPLLPRLRKRKTRKPILPTKDELARLPRGAALVLIARCARRAGFVAPPTDWRVEALAATVDAAALAIARRSGSPTQLLGIRRDLERLTRLATEQGWTEDTPVPLDVLDLFPQER